MAANWSLHARGFSVFPLLPRTKQPALEWGLYQTVPADPAAVALWSGWPDVNMGVATGAVSGVFVLDCDSTLARVEAEARGVPDTLTVATPRGTHFYFRHPGYPISNRAGRTWTGGAVDGWDIRGDGGFVVGPGSFFQPTAAELAKGKVPGAYTIERDAPVADAPAWLLALLPRAAVHAPAPVVEAHETSDYGRAALHHETAQLARALPGEINDQINRSAFALGQLVAGGEITHTEAWGGLMAALETLGVDGEEKAQGTAGRAWEAGQANPRAREAAPSVDAVLGVRGALTAPPPPDAPHLQAPFMPPAFPQYVGADAPQFFAGCAYVARRNEMFVPSGLMVGSSAFDAIYGGPQFALDMDGSKKTRSAWEMFRTNSQVRLPKVWDVCFRPELPAGQVVDLEGLPYLNTYVPIPTPRKAGDASPFVQHVRKMLPYGRDADYLLHWMASAVQNPGKKFQWWPVVQGVKGNGKSLLLAVMQAAIGERYSHLVRADALLKTGNQFNDWVFGKLFLGFEEIRSSEGKRDFVEIMKDTVTAKRLATEGKGKGQATTDNRANGLMLTNWDDACPIDDDERRWGIFYTAQQTEEDLHRDGMDGDYFPALYDWLNADGHAIVTHYLATLPLEAALDPARGLHRAPRTTSTLEAIGRSRGVAEQEVLDAIDAGQPGFRGGVVTSFALKALLDRIRKHVPPRKQRAFMHTLGYVTHPSLEASRGRPNNPIFDGTRPVLYFEKSSALLARSDTVDLIHGVEMVLKGDDVPAVGNVVPFRR